MKRKYVEQTKAEITRLLDRIEMMERMAGWQRYTDKASPLSVPHPDDSFNGGQYAAAVKRACLDVQKAMAEMRKS